MEIAHYLKIVYQRWWLVAAIMLIAGIASLLVDLREPPRYEATARLLVTVADPGRVDIEDPLAYDVPAIVSGQPFGQDVATLLASQGQAIQADQVMAALRATNQKRQVWLTASASDGPQAVAIVQAATTQLQRGGLRYWGAAAIIPERPGMNVVVLDLPTQAIQINRRSAIVLQVGLRMLAGGLLGALIAFALHAWHQLKGPGNTPPTDLQSN
jgi:hypothetical protein